MGLEGEKGALLVPSAAAENPIALVSERIKEWESGFRTWLARQPTPVEAAVVTAVGAAQGAAIGALMGSLASEASSAIPTPPPQAAAALNPQAMASFKQAQKDGLSIKLEFIFFLFLAFVSEENCYFLSCEIQAGLLVEMYQSVPEASDGSVWPAYRFIFEYSF